jgi:hypothetical protein
MDTAFFHLWLQLIYLTSTHLGNTSKSRYFNTLSLHSILILRYAVAPYSYQIVHLEDVQKKMLVYTLVCLRTLCTCTHVLCRLEE